MNNRFTFDIIYIAFIEKAVLMYDTGMVLYELYQYMIASKIANEAKQRVPT